VSANSYNTDFAYSSANAKKWEIELATLKNNNMRLTSALQESTANVEEWKRQLHSYKEENQRMKTKYIELEAAKGI
jgi:homer protein